MNRIQQSTFETSFRKLNELNQAIWDNGFTTETLTALAKLTKEVYNGTTLFERIPQAQQPGLSKGSEILIAAAIICRGCPETESEKREIYRTSDLIGDGRIQETLVENWARIVGCWFDDARLFLSSISQVYDVGTESTVFFDAPHRLVRKFITLKHYNVLRLALDRVIVHNAIFPSAYMRVFGFGRDEAGSFGLLIEQPYVEGAVVSESERADFMHKMGFTDAGEDYGMYLNYKTEELYIGDLNEYNVLKGVNGIHVFDCDCRLNTPALGCSGTLVIPQPTLDFSNPSVIQ
ncbi:MAG: hypothetical protein IJ152_04385 [Bacteroidales bacterium]|nr:hypothetical protein [Bacteroidales bacterium]